MWSGMVLSVLLQNFDLLFVGFIRVACWILACGVNLSIYCFTYYSLLLTPFRIMRGFTARLETLFISH